MRATSRASLVHAVTLSRLVIVGSVYLVLPLRNPWLVVALTLLAVGTDMADGILARRWATTSSLGANLDSAVDFVFYVSLVAWVWIWFGGSLVNASWPWVALFVLLYTSSLAFAKARRGEMGFHNFWTRFAATIGVITALWLMTFGWAYEIGTLLVALLVASLVADLTQRTARTLRSQGAAPSAASQR